MSDLSPKTNPQVLVNGEQQEQRQDEDVNGGQISAVSLDEDCEEDSISTDKDTQAKMQSLFQQVRRQIRSQVGAKAQKPSIMELVQRVRDRQTDVEQEDSEPDGDSEEKKETGHSTGDGKDAFDLKAEELHATYEKKLEASKKALMEEFEKRISQAHTNMQAYTDHALRDLECKMQAWQSLHLQQAHPKEPQPGRCTDKKQKASAAPSLAARRGRVLTRTMTTIIPKTCAPVIVGPRAKSENLSYSKAASSRPLIRDPVLSSLSKTYQSRRPLPPACPPLHQRRNPLGAKAKTVK